MSGIGDLRDEADARPGLRAGDPRRVRMGEPGTRMYRCRHEDRMSFRGRADEGRPRIDVEGVDAMGRGRQKAKQTKVARQLKYFSPETDYQALERELHGSSGHADDRTDGYGDDVGDEDDDWVSQEDARR
jgi:hypothetical protein